MIWSFDACKYSWLKYFFLCMHITWNKSCRGIKLQDLCCSFMLESFWQLGQLVMDQCHLLFSQRSKKLKTRYNILSWSLKSGIQRWYLPLKVSSSLPLVVSYVSVHLKSWGSRNCWESSYFHLEFRAYAFCQSSPFWTRSH